jgi:hypothetical protein
MSPNRGAERLGKGRADTVPRGGRGLFGFMGLGFDATKNFDVVALSFLAAREVDCKLGCFSLSATSVRKFSSKAVLSETGKVFEVFEADRSAYLLPPADSKSDCPFSAAVFPGTGVWLTVSSAAKPALGDPSWSSLLFGLY